MENISSQALFDEILEPVFDIAHLKSHLSKKKLHRARVSIKRTRARLNLVKHLADAQPEISELNQKLKQLNMQLSSQRNLDVAFKLITNLLKKKKSTQLSDELTEALRWVKQENLKENLDVETLGILIKEIELCYRRLPGVDIRANDIHKYISKRLRQICQHGESLLHEGNCTALHEWRKQIKKLYYQAEVLSDDKLTNRNKKDALQKLGNRLGEVHDICFLKGMLQHQENRPVSPTSSVNGPLLQYLEEKRRFLLKKCYKQYQLVCGKQPS
jgi:CHAD domain-containing protein